MLFWVLFLYFILGVVVTICFSKADNWEIDSLFFSGIVLTIVIIVSCFIMFNYLHFSFN